MKTKMWAIVLMFFTTLLTSTAQILYKIGVDSLEFNFISIITNLPIIVGLLIYIVAAALMIIALRGGELSVLYPIIATSYIWVGMLSFYIFHEALNILRWAGIGTIFIGIAFIGFGSKGESA